MSAIVPILIGIAAEVGAPLVKSILTKHAGPLAGSVAETVIKTIAGKAGVEPDELPNVPQGELASAVNATEAETPELLAQWVESQRLANQLQLAEMAKETGFSWMWRPAWMWFLMFLWAWLIVAVPLANATFGAQITLVDAGTLFSLTGAYLALYMGGHTIKATWGKK